eukprot:5550974-Amphidinium_carterae.1
MSLRELCYRGEQKTANKKGDVTERDIDLKLGLAADAADQVEDVAQKAGQLYVALQQLTSKEAFDVLRNACKHRPRRLETPAPKASNVTALRSALEKWEEQVRSHERRKDATGAEERLPAKAEELRRVGNR